jgi:hypothetical protein
MYKPPYTQELSRQYPGLFVILLDQSSSMRDSISGYPINQTKAHLVTRMVNDVIQGLIDRAGIEETNPGIRKKYAYLSVLGYDNTVRPLLSTVSTPVDIPTLARNPRGSVTENHEIRDKNNKLVRIAYEEKNFWVEPYDQGYLTNMKSAFEEAREIIKNWLAHPPELISPDLGYQMPRKECFPPVVINVTDGYYNDGGNPRPIINDICKMGTTNGNVLVFNCHFSTNNQQEKVFPKDISEVHSIVPQSPDEPYIRDYMEQMFYMSSVIPDPLIDRAQREMRKLVPSGAHGVIYNASFEVLAQFLRWGTVQIAPITQTGGTTWR